MGANLGIGSSVILGDTFREFPTCSPVYLSPWNPLREHWPLLTHGVLAAYSLH